ncbi:hypothetical protein VNO80_12650 [Phaseolus coccineus]|uniref:Uncharacterized protein n=1 Tax=Phaseolus coccineus TaxID=3886 RepID=A0AAN9N5P8_PHACN
MHDLIEDMGRQIDQQESPKELGKRRRLLLPKDIIHVLKHNTGTNRIEIISLDLSISEKEETLEWNANAFKRMKNLKILIIRNGKFSKGPNYFPESLSVLEWHGYPSNCLSSNFLPNKLVFCKLTDGNFASFGFHGSLKAKGCRKLMSFPPLNLPTLESLKLSYCSNLKKFPEILGKMGNVREEWRWVKSEKCEDNIGSMVSSKVDWFLTLSCNFDDHFFSSGFMQLAQVRNLFLWKNNFKFLPECIKEFHNLHTLDVSHCKHLQEIRGIPPKLEHFKAINCISLSSSSSSMLLNKQLHEARKTAFWFPGTSIPEWFDHQSSGPSCSFWFRNKFPAKVLSLLIAPVGDELHFIKPMVFIDGKVLESKFFCSKDIERMFELDHTFLFDLQGLPVYGNLFELPLEKEWKHVEVTYEGVIKTSIIKATGIHVFKEENSIMEDIRFDDPYNNKKVDKDLNGSQSQNHSLLQSIGLFTTYNFFLGIFLFVFLLLFFYFIY